MDYRPRLTAGMFAENTIMLVAAPMLIFCLLLFIVGCILFWRAYLNLKQAKPAKRTYYDPNGNDSNLVLVTSRNI